MRKSMDIGNTLFALFFLLSSATVSAALPFSESTQVRRSSSGICHPPSTAFFDRTRSYYIMQLDQCLAGVAMGKVKNHAGALNTKALPPGRLPSYLQEAWDVNKKCEDLLDDGKDATFECRYALEKEVERKKKETNLERFEAYRFGIGLSAAGFEGPLIDRVDVVESSVLVRERRDVVTSVMFESHKFFTFDKTGENFGIGPFVAASLTDDDGANPLSKFAAGIMMGWRRKGTDNSFNVGLGWIVDTDTTELLPGVSDGMMTDVANPTDLIRTTDKEGIVLLFSATW